jgi:hypothetical protein
MPNWCVGTLKVRGEKEDIKRFLLEGLQPIQSMSAILTLMGREVPEIKVSVSEDEYELIIKQDGKDGFHVKGTNRNFIDSNEITWNLEDEILMIEDYQAAWGIDTNGLTDLSAEYNLDFKIYAFEQGMEFNLDFEVHKGTVIKNDEIKFSNYEWECIEPNRGG